MPDKTNTQKLLIKEGYRVWYIHPPQNIAELLGDLPGGAEVVNHPEAPVDFILAFIVDRKELEKHLGELKQMIKPKGLLWIAYYKGTSKIKTDINRDSIHAYGRTLGLEGITMISLDDDWSAMRFKFAE